MRACLFFACWLIGWVVGRFVGWCRLILYGMVRYRTVWCGVVFALCAVLPCTVCCYMGTVLYLYRAVLCCLGLRCCSVAWYCFVSLLFATHYDVQFCFYSLLFVFALRLIVWTRFCLFVCFSLFVFSRLIPFVLFVRAFRTA